MRQNLYLIAFEQTSHSLEELEDIEQWDPKGVVSEIHDTQLTMDELCDLFPNRAFRVMHNSILVSSVQSLEEVKAKVSVQLMGTIGRDRSKLVVCEVSSIGSQGIKKFASLLQYISR